MSKVQASSDLSTIKPEEVQKYVTLALNDIVQTMNGNLDFVANIRGTISTVTFQNINVDTAVPHGLGRLPTGYIQMGLNTDANLYDGVTPNTDKTLYLRSTRSQTVAKIFIF